MTEVLVASLSVPAPDAGESAHVTPLLLGSLLTVAVNASVLPASTIATPPGATDTVIAGTVMLPVSDFVLSATEVAVMLTAKSLAGGLAGAL